MFANGLLPHLLTPPAVGAIIDLSKRKKTGLAGLRIGIEVV